MNRRLAWGLVVGVVAGLGCGPMDAEVAQPTGDAGVADGGPAIAPRVAPTKEVSPGAGAEQPDAGDEAHPDAGTVDAGRPDAGTVDAGRPNVSVAPARAKLLDTTVVARIVEPEGVGHDDLGTGYTDRNYWNFCVPGAITAALYYWKPHNVTAWPAGRFREPSHAPSTIPSRGTYWNSDGDASGYRARGRAYLMHIAMQVRPPNFTAPGAVSFATYPSTGGGLADARDVLNWEASGHAAGWSRFFYVAVGASSVTQTTMHSHIKQDIDGGHAVVVFASTAFLPNWDRTLRHAITVVGYDDDARTYTYVDTCGRRCNGSSASRNGGLWSISQANLSRAARQGAGYVW